MCISEFKVWLKFQKALSVNDFFYVKERILYMEVMLNILNKNYFISLNKIFQISSFVKKIKLLIFLLIAIFFKNFQK
jgi:hypothetical protein